MYRATRDESWLTAARRACALACEARTGDSHPAGSLWRGDLGVALLALELEFPDRAAMPLYRSVLTSPGRV
jgi:hypothetical protein